MSWGIGLHFEIFTLKDQKRSILYSIRLNLDLNDQFHFHSPREPNKARFQHSLEPRIRNCHEMFNFLF